MMEVEWLILADAAQVVGNKLYLLGGGWDVLTVNSGFPLRRQLGIAASVKVPWNQTNEHHNLQLQIVSEDGEVVGTVTGEFEVGRPPGIKLGQDQRLQIAAGVDMEFKKEGAYTIVASLDGTEARRVAFNVTPGLGVKAARRRQEPPPSPSS